MGDQNSTGKVLKPYHVKIYILTGSPGGPGSPALPYGPGVPLKKKKESKLQEGVMILGKYIMTGFKNSN